MVLNLGYYDDHKLKKKMTKASFSVRLLLAIALGPVPQKPRKLFASTKSFLVNQCSKTYAGNNCSY